MATIFGTAGNDTLAATARFDELFGLAGNDRLTTTFSDVNLSGGTGDDWLRASSTGVKDEFGTIEATGTLSGDNGNDMILSFASLFSSTLNHGDPTAYQSAYNLVGGTGNDTLHSASNINVHTGQQDFISVDDFLRGDDGNDDLSSISHVSTDDRTILELDLSGGQGDDHLSASATLSVTGDLGNRATVFLSLDGGSGNDILQAHSSNASETGSAQYSSYLEGGSGNDHIIVDSRDTGGTGGFESVYINAGTGNDCAIIHCAATSGDSAEIDISVFGDDFRDFLGAGGDDLINIDATVNAPQGIISIAGYGQAGNDRILASATTHNATDTVSLTLGGGGGNDFVSGKIVAPAGTGSQHLYGDDGNDQLIAQGGNNNQLEGDRGNDTATGSSNADLFYQDYSSMADGVKDRDVITNYSKAEGDKLALPNGIHDVASWMVTGHDTQLTLVGDHDVLVLKNVVVTDLAHDILFA